MTSKEKYQALCNNEPSIPIFSRYWWLDTVCGKNHWDVLLAEENGKTIAAMPLYIPHCGIVSMPQFTQTMGPWFAAASGDTKYTTLLGRHQEICKAFVETLRPYTSFLQNFSYEITDWLPFYWNGYSQTTRYTYLLHQIKDENTIMENMSPNIRRNISKARDKYHIRVKKGITTEEFLRVQRQTYSRQQLMMKEDTNTLAELIKEARERGQGDLWGGYDDNGDLHAVAFIVWQESSAYYLAGGENPGLRKSGAHSLVIRESIRYVSQYTDTFNFEGSMIPGIERFFREFGAKQTPYFTITRGKLSLIYRAWSKLVKIFMNNIHYAND